jgi:hypothetical protein
LARIAVRIQRKTEIDQQPFALTFNFDTASADLITTAMDDEVHN